MSPDDGLRVLATHFRGRAMPKSRYDLWLPSLGPSENLLARFSEEEISWSEFSQNYRLEIWTSSEIDQSNKSNKNHGQKGLLRTLRYLSRRQRVTLMCHCEEDAECCHRYLLKNLLTGSKVTL